MGDVMLILKLSYLCGCVKEHEYRDGMSVEMECPRHYATDDSNKLTQMTLYRRRRWRDKTRMVVNTT
jgi:hypothetical protein